MEHPTSVVRSLLPTFNFVAIADLGPEESHVDLLAKVTAVEEEPTPYTAQSGKEMQRLSLMLSDSSGM